MIELLVAPHQDTVLSRQSLHLLQIQRIQAAGEGLMMSQTYMIAHQIVITLLIQRVAFFNKLCGILPAHNTIRCPFIRNKVKLAFHPI